VTDFLSKKLSTELVVIDPRPLTLRALTQMLARAYPENITTAVSSAKELLKLPGAAANGSPPLVFLYIRNASVADPWVHQELQAIWARFPAAPVALLSDREEADQVAQALSSGVRGYIPTSVNWDLAFAALGLIDVGGTYMPVHLTSSAAKRPSDVAETELMLTARELSVARLLYKPNKMIAGILQIEEGTVKVHIKNILRKLHATNRAQAAVAVEGVLGSSATASAER
jgi:DNA-binding NarL/FixJ family response regulator